MNIRRAQFLKLAVSMTTIAGSLAFAVTPALANGPGVCALETDRKPNLEWEVASQADLLILESDHADCSNKTIYQTANIDLAGWANPVRHWHGVFNGNGYEFTDSTDGPEAALFDSPDGELTLRNVHRSGDVSADDGAAGAAGTNGDDEEGGGDGADGSDGSDAGGLVGSTSDPLTITNSSFEGNVTGGDGGNGGNGGYGGYTTGPTNMDGGNAGTGGRGGTSGGLVGYASSEVTIVNSWADGIFTAGEVGAAGTPGATGTGGAGGNIGAIGFPGQPGAVGGLIGELTTSGSTHISRSQVTGDIVGQAHLGGLIGLIVEFSAVTIDDSNTEVTLDGDREIGGIIGLADRSNLISINESRASIDLANDGADHVGGLVGRTYDDVDLSIDHSWVDSEVRGDENVGGLIGWATGPTTIEDSYTYEGVSGRESVGGLIGYSYLSTPVAIVRSYSTGTVQGSQFISGLIGYSEDEVEVSESFTTSEVSGDNYVGAFVGYAAGDVVLENVYGRGTLAASGDTAGGFVGYAEESVSITNSYTTSDVDTPNYQGGFIGDPEGSVTISASFCLVSANGCGEGDDDVTATAADLKSRDFLELTHGWSFEDIWCIRPWANNAYPILNNIAFGPGDTNGCHRSRPTRRTVTLDPAGGRCTSRSSRWSERFRHSFQLPTATDCERDGHVFLGWSADPTLTTSEDLLTGAISRSANLTAVWGALPAAPASLNILANFLCGRNCTSAVVVWPVATDTDVITVDGLEATCETKVEAFGLRGCLVTGLTSGSSHTASVSGRNQYGIGPATTTSFTLL